MNPLQQLFSAEGLLLFSKGALLIFIGFAIIYGILLFTQGQALKKIVFIKAANGSMFIQLLTIIYLIACISLFLIALAIL